MFNLKIRLSNVFLMWNMHIIYIYAKNMHVNNGLSENLPSLIFTNIAYGIISQTAVNKC